MRPLTNMGRAGRSAGAILRAAPALSAPRQAAKAVLRIASPLVLAYVLSVLLAIGCSDDDGQGPGPAPDSTVTFRFAIRHDLSGTEDFIAVTSDSAVIAVTRAQLLLVPDERTLHIHGPIDRGNGGHNLSWSWHFVPGEWELVQFSMELCDGNPSAVEADIDTWVDVIGVFCPWNSYVAEELP